MTRVDIRTNIRQMTEDQGSYFTDGNINDAIQECYDLLCPAAGLIQKRTTLNFQGGLVYYDFPSLILDFYSLTAIFNNVTNFFLTPATRDSMDNLRRDWEVMQGNARWFIPITNQYVALVPHNTASSGTFDVLYNAKAPTLDDTTTLQITSSFGEVFQDYVMCYLMEKAREFMKASLHNQSFNIKSAKLIKNVGNIAWPDRMFSLGGR